MVLTAESIRQMKDEELAALESAMEDVLSYFATEDRIETLTSLMRLVNNICLERSIDTKYYIQKNSVEVQAAYDKFRHIL